MKEWTQLTGVRFEQVPNGTLGSMRYLSKENNGVSTSTVGYNANGIGNLTMDVNSCHSAGYVIRHELGHTLGLFHTQSRTDRDQHVRVVTDNIEDKYRYAFRIAENALAIGDYDVRSVMHYSGYLFSKNGEPTLVLRDSGEPIPFSGAIAASDVQSMRLLYGLSDPVERRATDGCSGVRINVGSRLNIRPVPGDLENLCRTPLQRRDGRSGAHGDRRSRPRESRLVWHQHQKRGRGLRRRHPTPSVMKTRIQTPTPTPTPTSIRTLTPTSIPIRTPTPDPQTCSELRVTVNTRLNVRAQPNTTQDPIGKLEEQPADSTPRHGRRAIDLGEPRLVRDRNRGWEPARLRLGRIRLLRELRPRAKARTR